MLSKEEQDETKEQKKEARHQRLQERRQYEESVVKVCPLGHTKNPYKAKMREALRNRVVSYSVSNVKAPSGRMHLVK